MILMQVTPSCLPISCRNSFLHMLTVLYMIAIWSYWVKLREIVNLLLSSYLWILCGPLSIVITKNRSPKTILPETRFHSMLLHILSLLTECTDVAWNVMAEISLLLTFLAFKQNFQFYISFGQCFSLFCESYWYSKAMCIIWGHIWVKPIICHNHTWRAVLESILGILWICSLCLIHLYISLNMINAWPVLRLCMHHVTVLRVRCVRLKKNLIVTLKFVEAQDAARKCLTGLSS